MDSCTQNFLRIPLNSLSVVLVRPVGSSYYALSTVSLWGQARWKLIILYCKVETRISPPGSPDCKKSLRWVTYHWCSAFPWEEQRMERRTGASGGQGRRRSLDWQDFSSWDFCCRAPKVSIIWPEGPLQLGFWKTSVLSLKLVRGKNMFGACCSFNTCLYSTYESG